MAVIDASEGRIRNVMQKLQRYCFSFDPQGQTYVLKINRIVLVLTLLFVVVFGLFLLLRGRVNPRRASN